MLQALYGILSFIAIILSAASFSPIAQSLSKRLFGQEKPVPKPITWMAGLFGLLAGIAFAVDFLDLPFKVKLWQNKNGGVTSPNLPPPVAPDVNPPNVPVPPPTAPQPPVAKPREPGVAVEDAVRLFTSAQPQWLVGKFTDDFDVRQGHINDAHLFAISVGVKRKAAISIYCVPYGAVHQIYFRIGIVNAPLKIVLHEMYFRPTPPAVRKYRTLAVRIEDNDKSSRISNIYSGQYDYMSSNTWVIKGSHQMAIDLKLNDIARVFVDGVQIDTVQLNGSPQAVDRMLRGNGC